MFKCIKGKPLNNKTLFKIKSAHWKSREGNNTLAWTLDRDCVKLTNRFHSDNRTWAEINRLDQMSWTEGLDDAEPESPRGDVCATLSEIICSDPPQSEGRLNKRLTQPVWSWRGRQSHVKAFLSCISARPFKIKLQTFYGSKTNVAVFTGLWRRSSVDVYGHKVEAVSFKKWMRSSPPSIQSGDSELRVSAHDDDFPSRRAVYTNQLFKGSPTAREREGETGSCSVHADCMFTLRSHTCYYHTHTLSKTATWSQRLL